MRCEMQNLLLHFEQSMEIASRTRQPFRPHLLGFFSGAMSSVQPEEMCLSIWASSETDPVGVVSILLHSGQTGTRRCEVVRLEVEIGAYVHRRRRQRGSCVRRLMRARRK